MCDKNSNSPKLMCIGEHENDAEQSIKITVIVPRAHVDHENVPIGRIKQETRQLEFVADCHAESACNEKSIFSS